VEVETDNEGIATAKLAKVFGHLVAVDNISFA